jgi:hypothetical protein
MRLIGIFEKQKYAYPIENKRIYFLLHLIKVLKAGAEQLDH